MSQNQDELRAVLNDLYQVSVIHDQLQWWIVDVRKKFKDIPQVQEGLDASQAKLDNEMRRVALAREQIRRRLAK